MGISLGGVNLDVRGLVSQLMTLESRPLERLQEKETEFRAQLSAIGKLRSALSSFRSTMGDLKSLDKFEIYKATTNESETDQSFKATLNSSATPGVFSVEVLNLARSNKFGSTLGFADKDTTTFTATANLDISDGTDSLSIDINGKTLEQIRDEINTEAGTNNVGVSASIIQESASQFQLVISSTETGLANKALVTSTGNAVSQLDLSEKQTALDASVLVDNSYTLTSATNTISNAISGVTLELLKPSTAPANLKIERDIDAVKESINDFVNAYNSLNSTIKDLKKGDLKGDSALNSILSGIRNEFNTDPGLSTAFNFLSEVGIQTDPKTGDLSLNATTLDNAVATDYEAISQLFANDDQGVAFRLDKLINSYLETDGMIASRQNGLNSRIRSNEDDQARWEYRLEQIEKRYLQQFTALDSLISEMNSTGSYLSQQLASLPGASQK